MDSLILTRLEEENYPFEDFKSEVLMNRSIIESFQNIINKCKQQTNEKITINARDLLSIYLFKFFGFSDVLEEVSSDVIYNIQDMMGRNDDDSIRMFVPHILAYQQKYLEWKSEDVNEVLQGLTQLFWEFELIYHLNEHVFSESEKQEFIEKKNEKQQQIVDRMKMMDNLEYFYSYVPIVFDEQMVNVVHSTIKKAFWDSIKAEFPDITKLLVVIDEMKGYIIFLVPRQTSILENLEETFDIPYMKQLSDINAMDTDYWYRKCQYLYALVKELDSVSMDTNHDEQWFAFDNKFNDADALMKQGLCVEYFEFIVERLYQLVQIKKSII